MRKQLYWLKDAEWKRIELLLPAAAVGHIASMIGVSSVASCICCVRARTGAIARRNTAPTRRSTIASIVGASRVCGPIFSTR